MNVVPVRAMKAGRRGATDGGMRTVREIAPESIRDRKQENRYDRV